MASPSPAPTTLAPSGPITRLIPEPSVTRYRRIHWERYPQDTGTPIWACYTNTGHHKLGTISHYQPWRSWVFAPLDNTILSAECLTDILHFIAQVTL